MTTPNPHPQKKLFFKKMKSVDKHLVKQILKQLELAGFKTCKPSKFEKN
jgi:hypothetical protein